MSNRHLSRTIAMQSLYIWDFNKLPDTDIDAIVDLTLQEFAPGLADGEFAQRTATGVLEHRAEIDGYIAKYAPEWPIEQMTFVDRNTMRIGLYEMLHNDDIPERVAINEAIEIAKAYGGDSSGKFVNGVLGAIYKDLQAEGKTKEQKQKT